MSTAYAVTTETATALPSPKSTAIGDSDTSGTMSTSEDLSNETVVLFADGDVVAGRLVGKGSFNNIYKVERFRNCSTATFLTFLDSASSSSTPVEENEENDESNPENIKRTHERNLVLKRLHERNLVLKRLHERTLSSKRATKIATKDLSMEAKILSNLPFHENIIRLYGISEAFDTEPTCPRKGFLILGQLEGGTLGERLFKWRREARIARQASLFGSLFQCGKVKQEQERDRVAKAALGVARAMEFLHIHRIIYRDMKPENIGFDTLNKNVHDKNDLGTIKLFDFGLARKLLPENEGKDGYKLTGMTGTLRYMAPEVVRKDPYGFPADVHAFSILLWQICSLQQPFDDIASLDELVKRVVVGKERPLLNRQILSKPLKKLLKQCWNPTARDRPSFSKVVEVLEAETATSRTGKQLLQTIQ